MFLQADDRKVTRTAASIAVAAEHCLNLHAGEFAQQQADRRRSGGKEPCGGWMRQDFIKKDKVLTIT